MDAGGALWAGGDIAFQRFGDLRRVVGVGLAGVCVCVPVVRVRVLVCRVGRGSRHGARCYQIWYTAPDFGGALLLIMCLLVPKSGHEIRPVFRARFWGGPCVTHSVGGAVINTRGHTHAHEANIRTDIHWGAACSSQLAPSTQGGTYVATAADHGG